MPKDVGYSGKHMGYGYKEKAPKAKSSGHGYSNLEKTGNYSREAFPRYLKDAAGRAPFSGRQKKGSY